MLKWGKQDPIFFRVLQMIKTLEYNHQFMLYLTRIFTVGFKKYFERPNAVLSSHQMSNAYFLHTFIGHHYSIID